ncbi:asparagine synthase-related protein [Amycolatopsis anabasis]|uniref:asparagine synthase-related protein n=1 Tax=Amycolatopsis anabasis TaxID=1840409 RepID=UPI001C55478A|nr:asparagine synthase-related protein [Amycolatopsis anabasis]
MLSQGWLVLPDRADSRSWVLAMSAVLGSPEVVPYASGRPWLAGRWAPGELTVARAGSVRVAVIGSRPVTATRLTELIARVRRVADLDTLVRGLSGSAHVVAEVDGVLRVQGSGPAGLRRVLHTRVGDAVVAGDRADVLAAVTGADIDERVLAARVACGALVPPPLNDLPFWHGIRAVAPDHYLRIDHRTGTAEAVRWWCPPVPEQSMAEGAGAVREALRTAVAARVSGAGNVSADLSGGMDSTSLCFLTAEIQPEALQVTFRWAESDASNDDGVYAVHAATALPTTIEHLVLPAVGPPWDFDNPSDLADTETPFPFARVQARFRHTAEFLTGRGARVHLAGQGGDELFDEFPHYLHDLLRRRPWTALKHIRGFGALLHWPLPAVLAALHDPQDLPGWWRAQADQLTAPPPARYTPDLGWGHPLRAQTWSTPTAIDATRDLLYELAEQASPLAPQRGQHTTLAVLRMAGSGYRQMLRLFTTGGIQLDMPFLDTSVIEAALAVRAHERRTPWRYKPLLAEAMRGILPDTIAGRATKGHFSEDLRLGLKRNLPAILDLFTDSALAAHGLIDPDALRSRLLAPQVDHATTFALEHLLGAETWLRNTHTPPTPVPIPVARTETADKGNADEPAPAP